MNELTRCCGYVVQPYRAIDVRLYGLLWIRYTAGCTGCILYNRSTFYTRSK